MNSAVGREIEIRQMERLVKGLDARVSRQRSALADSESQLEAARNLLLQAQSGQSSLPLVVKK